MKIDESTLGELYRQDTAAAGTHACPSPDALMDLASGQLEGAERTAVVEHLATCSDCARDYQMVTSLEGWSEDLAARLDREERGAATPQTPAMPPPPMPFAPPRPGSSRPRRWQGLVLAAAAVLLFGVVGLRLFLPGDPEGPGTGLRGPEAGLGTGSLGASVLPADQAVLPAAPRQLRWPPQVGATGYRVRLFDARAELLWESSETAQTWQAVPRETAQGLTAGSSYFWTVEVAGAAVSSRLGPFWFRVEATAP